MEDPAVVAGRLTQTAKDIADQARAIAKEAIYESSDVGTYTTGKFIDTFTKSVDLAVRSGIQLGKDVVDQPGPPDPHEKNRKQVADVMETIGRRMIRQAGAVAHDAAEQLEYTPNSPNVWVRSMVKLANISLLGSIELAETALIGPAKHERRLTLSDDFDADGTGARTLQFKEPDAAERASGEVDGLHRPGTSDPIPAELVSFHAATAVGMVPLPLGGLANGQNKFRIGVDPRLLISGIYIGTVEVIDADNHVLYTVPVQIAI